MIEKKIHDGHQMIENEKRILQANFEQNRDNASLSDQTNKAKAPTATPTFPKRFMVSIMVGSGCW